MYDPLTIQPFRDELTNAGFTELRAVADVDAALTAKGTALVVVNSVCGCAAGQARPGAALAAKHPKAPEKLFTVFAGQDAEATARARSFFTGYPPSSPSIAILRDGRLLFLRPENQTRGTPRPPPRRLATRSGLRWAGRGTRRALPSPSPPCGGLGGREGMSHRDPESSHRRRSNQHEEGGQRWTSRSRTTSERSTVRFGLRPLLVTWTGTRSPIHSADSKAPLCCLSISCRWGRSRAMSPHSRSATAPEPRWTVSRSPNSSRMRSPSPRGSRPGTSRWSLRVNPSSGNLHPTEGYLVAGPIAGLHPRPAVYHYTPFEHALELRAELSGEAWLKIAAQHP